MTDSEIKCHCGCGRKYVSQSYVEGNVIKSQIVESPPPIKPVLTDTFWNKGYHGVLICGRIASTSGHKPENPETWYNDNKHNIVENKDEFSYLLDPYSKEFINESGQYLGMTFGWGYPRKLEYRPQWHVFGKSPPKWGGNWQETYDGSCHWFSMTS